MPHILIKTFISLVFLLISITYIEAATHPFYAYTSNEIYPTQPSEVLPIQPLLIYPPPREDLFQARNLENDEDDIIYIKLVRSKGYHPKQNSLQSTSTKTFPKDKDIFYVKALTNGMFSQDRLKVFRLPEFYSISVYRNGEKM